MSFASNTRPVNCTVYTQLTQRKRVPTVTLRVIATLATVRENLIFSIGNSKCKHKVAFTQSLSVDVDIDVDHDHDHEPTPVKFKVVEPMRAETRRRQSNTSECGKWSNTRARAHVCTIEASIQV